MKLVHNKAIAASLVFGLASCLVQTAQAHSSFENKINLIYTIDSIVNNTNNGSLSGLSITGDASSVIDSNDNGFGGVSTFTVPFGFSDSNPGANIFDYTLESTGDIGADPLAFSQVSLGAFANLVLENTGTDEYDIQVTLSYMLMSDVVDHHGGDTVSSSAFLEYSARPPRRGSGIVTDDVLAEIGGILSDSANNSAVFQINLSGVSESTILARLEVDGLAGTVVANVPEPNTILLLLTAFVTLPVMRKKKRQNVFMV